MYNENWRSFLQRFACLTLAGTIVAEVATGKVGAHPQTGHRAKANCTRCCPRLETCSVYLLVPLTEAWWGRGVLLAGKGCCCPVLPCMVLKTARRLRRASCHCYRLKQALRH